MVASEQDTLAVVVNYGFPNLGPARDLKTEQKQEQVKLAAGRERRVFVSFHIALFYILIREEPYPIYKLAIIRIKFDENP